MQSVQLVLEENLPVGVLHDTETIGNDLCFAFGCAVTNVVERHFAAPEPGFKIGSVFAQARENEAAIVALERAKGLAEDGKSTRGLVKGIDAQITALRGIVRHGHLLPNC